MHKHITLATCLLALPFFTLAQTALEIIEKADEKMQWVFISQSPGNSWYNKIKVGDDKLYLNSTNI